MNFLTFLQKHKLLLLLLLVVLFLIPLTFRFLLNKDQASPANRFPPPLKVTPLPNAVTQPVPTINTSSDDPQKRLLDFVQHRRPLSPSDQVAKTHILSLLPSGQASGVLYKTSLMSIEYVHSADQFQVQILTDNVVAAKTQAIAWFQSQNVSHQGICTYPVSFYLNFQLANQYRQEHKTFNPLPDGC